MTATSDVEQRPAWRRLKKGVRFVAIVWGVAGAFLALQYLESLLLGTALDMGALNVDLVTSDVPENEACGHQVAALEPAELDAAGLAQSRRQALDLGLDLGFESVDRQVEMTGGTPEPRQPVDRARLAAELGVPLPEDPEITQEVNLFQEYSNHLAADRQCVAAHLAKIYSPRHASLFRLGAVVGPSVGYRRLGFTAAPYRADVRRYGSAAGVPPDLLEPLTREADPGDPGGLRQEAESVLERLQEWVSSAAAAED